MEFKVKSDYIYEKLLLENQNQNWLATKARISTGYLSDILSGKKYPSGRIRKRLMKALEVTDWKLLFELLDN